jgi:D-3-phosphoglycerate dehydrogenase
VLLALAGDFVPFAVNVDASAVSETVRPFLPLAENLGRLFASLCDTLPETIEIEFQGDIGGYDNKLTALSLTKGMLAYVSDEPVSYVNATNIARERGITIKSSNNPVAKDFVNCITVRGGGHSLGGTLVGVRSEHRIVSIDEHSVDVPPADHMLVVRNNDQPGMVGFVGTVLGRHRINIGDMHLGRSADGIPAMIVIGTDVRASADVQAEIAAHDGILSVNAIGLA